LTSATCSGGKTTRAARARLVLKALEAMLGEPPSPPADQASGGVQSGGDLGVRDASSGMQHDPRPLNLLKRELLRPRDPLKF
jgi:hypothetical protein